MMGISFDAASLFESTLDDDAADHIVFPTKCVSTGRIFRAMQNGKVKRVQNRFGGDAGSNYDIDYEGRRARIQRRLALQELREVNDGDHVTPPAAKTKSSCRCGTQAPTRNSASDVADYGDVQVIMKGGRIVAAFAGRSRSESRRTQF